MAEDLGEKTELPTERRRLEARRRGQVARSTDLGSAIDLIAAALVLALLGGWIADGLAGLTRRVLEDEAAGYSLRVDGVPSLLAWAAVTTGWLVAPLLAIMLAAGVLAQGVQVGWLFTTTPLQPKLDKLNPVAGVRRLLSRRNLVKTVINTVKLAITGIVAGVVLSRDFERVVALPNLELLPALHEVGRMLLELVAWLLALLLVIGFVDWMFQRWQHTQDLRMTRHEVQDERRMVEGDPEVKSRQLRMARQIAMQRISSAVPTADVVVTNPTHVSVALKYDSETMRAPKVVAKGAEWLAMRIRQVAALHGVPIVERPPLARALYTGVEPGQEISPEFYEAVAEVLAYVYRMEEAAA